MKIAQDFKIEQQRSLILGKKPKVNLIKSCKINEGISRFLPGELEQFSAIFSSSKKSTCFFIPASGSGSRMFDFLNQYLENPNDENFKKSLFLLNNVSSFAFYYELSSDVIEKLKNFDISLNSFIHYILEQTGKDYGNLPKAFFPFHRVGEKNLNPFQEHILQGKLLSEAISYHFTIQKKFTDLLKSFVDDIESKSKRFAYCKFL